MSGAVKSPLAQWAFIMNPVGPVTEVRPMPAELWVAHGGSAYVDGDPLPATYEPDSTPTSITARTANDYQPAPNTATVSKKVIDALVTKMTAGDRAAKQKLIEIGEPAVAPLIKALGDENDVVIASAAEALRKIGEPAIDPLLEAYNHAWLHDASLNVLVRIGEPVFVRLIQALDDEDDAVRARAADVLAEMGDPRAFELFIEALGDKDFRIRVYAACGLGSIGDPRAVGPLIQALSDESIEVRGYAAAALFKIGDPRAVEPLIEAKADGLLSEIDAYFYPEIVVPRDGEDPNTDVLVMFGKSTLEPFIRALSHENSDVRLEAAWALGEIRDERAVEPLIRALSDENIDVRGGAAGALGKIGEPAVESLIRAFESDDSEVQEYVVEVLKKIRLDNTSKLSMQSLIKALGSDHSSVRVFAAEFLGKIRDERAVESLIRALSDGNWRVRDKTLEALGEIGKPAVESLIKALRDDNESVRANAAKALGEIGDARAVKPLIKALGDESKGVRRLAAWGLREIGDRRAVEPLIKALGDESKDVRRLAAWGLGEIADRRAVEPLIKALRDEDWRFIDNEQALSKIGEPAVGPLIQALSDENIDVRGGATGALMRIGDKVVADYLAKNPDTLEERGELLEELAKRFEWTSVREIVSETERAAEREDELRESLGEKIREITGTIKDKLTGALGLKGGLKATVAGDRGSYGSVSLGVGLRLEQRLELRMELLPGNFLKIEVTESAEEIKERMHTLNFLVHHEMAHVVQKERSITRPGIDSSRYPHFDSNAVVHHANEVMLDKLGFDMARKIYVHGDGDIVFDERLREIISIHSYLTLSGIVLRNHESETHTLSDENIAREIAVLREMAESAAISGEVKREITERAKAFYSIVATDKDTSDRVEFDQLIKVYRRIFKETELEI